jgi:hypothetical protein
MRSHSETLTSIDRADTVGRFFEQYDRFREIVSSCAQGIEQPESAADSTRLNELDDKIAAIEMHLATLKPFFGEASKNTVQVLVPFSGVTGEHSHYRIFGFPLSLPFRDIESQFPDGIFNMGEGRRPIVTVPLLRTLLETAEELPDGALEKDLSTLEVKPYITVAGGTLSEYLLRAGKVTAMAREIHDLFTKIESKGSSRYMERLRKYSEVMSGETFEASCNS